MENPAEMSQTEQALLLEDCLDLVTKSMEAEQKPGPLAWSNLINGLRGTRHRGAFHLDSNRRWSLNAWAINYNLEPWLVAHGFKVSRKGSTTLVEL